MSSVCDQANMGPVFARRLARIAEARAALWRHEWPLQDRRTALLVALLELASNVLGQAEDQLDRGDHAKRLEGISRDVAQLCADIAAEG